MEYTFTCTVSEPGAVAGIDPASFHKDELGTTKGDGIASAKGCFGVPLIAPVPTTAVSYTHLTLPTKA